MLQCSGQTARMQSSKARRKFWNIVEGMKFPIGILAVVIAAGSAALGQDFAGRWVGVADTIDEAGTKRQERHTIEIKNEDGKLSAMRMGRNGKGSVVQVQTDGAKLQLIEFIPLDGGEPLRWKLTLADDSLKGTYLVQHDNPKKWIYDRTGPISLTKEKTPAPVPAVK